MYSKYNPIDNTSRSYTSNQEERHVNTGRKKICSKLGKRGLTLKPYPNKIDSDGSQQDLTNEDLSSHSEIAAGMKWLHETPVKTDVSPVTGTSPPKVVVSTENGGNPSVLNSYKSLAFDDSLLKVPLQEFGLFNNVFPQVDTSGEMFLPPWKRNNAEQKSSAVLQDVMNLDFFRKTPGSKVGSQGRKDVEDKGKNGSSINTDKENYLPKLFNGSSMFHNIVNEPKVVTSTESVRVSNVRRNIIKDHHWQENSNLHLNVNKVEMKTEVKLKDSPPVVETKMSCATEKLAPFIEPVVVQNFQNTVKSEVKMKNSPPVVETKPTCTPFIEPVVAQNFQNAVKTEVKMKNSPPVVETKPTCTPFIEPVVAQNFQNVMKTEVKMKNSPPVLETKPSCAEEKPAPFVEPVITHKVETTKDDFVPVLHSVSEEKLPSTSAAEPVQKVMAPPSSNTFIKSMPHRAKPTFKPSKDRPNAANNGDNSVKKPNSIPEQLCINGRSYRVISTIGKGGSSDVYLVLKEKSLQLMAVKCVNLYRVEKAIADGYINEVQLLLKLQGCEGVIRMFDYQFVEDEKMLYVVMEKGDTDLSKLIHEISKTQKIPMTMIMYYWTEMLCVVKEIHDKGVIHSDLKPGNFLLVKGRLKLIDFGIASSLQGDMTSVLKDVTTGTWNYMSPEAIRNNGNLSHGIKINYKSDVWSLGCILYSLVYGKTPFSHISGTWAKLMAIVEPSHNIAFPEEVENRGRVPPIILKTLKKCLTRDPKLRPSVSELLNYDYSMTSDKASNTNDVCSKLSIELKEILPAELLAKVLDKVENVLRE